MDAAFAANTGHLRAAEWGAEIAHEPAIHPAEPDLELGRTNRVQLMLVSERCF